MVANGYELKVEQDGSWILWLIGPRGLVDACMYIGEARAKVRRSEAEKRQRKGKQGRARQTKIESAKHEKARNQKLEINESKYLYSCCTIFIS